MLKNLSLIVLVTLACAWTVAANNGKCPKERMQEADECARVLIMLGNRNATIPQKLEEIDEYCDILLEKAKCVRNFATECLTPLPRQLFRTILYGVFRTHRKVCRSKELKQIFLNHMSACATPEVVDASHRCMELGTLKAEMIGETLKFEDQIPGACCGAHLIQDCVLSNIRNKCDISLLKVNGNSSLNDTVDFYQNLLENIFGDILDLACGAKYRALEACDLNLPHIMKIFREFDKEQLAAEEPAIPKAKSVLLPIVDIFVKYNYRRR